MVVPKSMSKEANRTACHGRSEVAAGVTRRGPRREPRGRPVLDPKGPFLAYQRPSLCHQAFQPYLEAMTVHFPFQNSYSALPDNFFARVAPTPVAAPRLIKLNRPLAVQLGLDPDLLSSPEGAEILAGKRVPDGADPIAMAYAGHQFG